MAYLRLVSEAVKKMQGKISEIARSHIASRVLQVIMLTSPHSSAYCLHLLIYFKDFEFPLLMGIYHLSF